MSLFALLLQKETSSVANCTYVTFPWVSHAILCRNHTNRCVSA